MIKEMTLTALVRAFLSPALCMIGVYVAKWFYDNGYDPIYTIGLCGAWCYTVGIVQEITLGLLGYGLADPRSKTPEPEDASPQEGEPKKEQLPNWIYYSNQTDNFYRAATGRGMGPDFYKEWRARADEFPGNWDVFDSSGVFVSDEIASSEDEAIRAYLMRRGDPRHSELIVGSGLLTAKKV